VDRYAHTAVPLVPRRAISKRQDTVLRHPRTHMKKRWSTQSCRGGTTTDGPGASACHRGERPGPRDGGGGAGDSDEVYEGQQIVGNITRSNEDTVRPPIYRDTFVGGCQDNFPVAYERVVTVREMPTRPDRTTGIHTRRDMAAELCATFWDTPRFDDCDHVKRMVKASAVAGRSFGQATSLLPSSAGFWSSSRFSTSSGSRIDVSHWFGGQRCPATHPTCRSSADCRAVA
jgi:hypothetical protein